MGRKSLGSEERVRKLFREFKESTNNYKDVSEEFLVKHPQLLFVIRLACGMSQRIFSNKVNFDRSALVHSELGISKTMKISNVKKIYPNLLELIEKANFSENSVLENYNKFLYQASKGQPPEKLRFFGRRALKYKRPTKQETRITKILESQQISFEKEGILTLDGMEFVFEFLTPNSKNPEFIIECKNAETKNKRNLKIVGYRIAYEIGYKSYLIRKNYPKTKIAVVIDHNQQSFPERVNKILEQETDVLLVNPTEKEISSKLKLLCRVRG